MADYLTERQRRDYQGRQWLQTHLAHSEQKADALPSALIDKQAQSSVRINQSQSQLLTRIPIELRLQIWQYAIGNQTFHIINKYRRLGHAVMDADYWRQHHAERPSLRACSWMYTYGSLPTTKQLADRNLCHLLVTCQQIYQEAVALLYSTNTFVVWDLRTVEVLQRCIPLSSWEAIRSLEVNAMWNRQEDMDLDVWPRALMQLEAWPAACTALASLPNLRSLKILVANPWYLDQKWLTGQQSNVLQAVLDFVEECKVRVEVMVYLPGMDGQKLETEEKWDLKGLEKRETVRLRQLLHSGPSGSDCHQGQGSRAPRYLCAISDRH